MDGPHEVNASSHGTCLCKPHHAIQGFDPRALHGEVGFSKTTLFAKSRGA
jgi:hypothetical protein